MLESQVVGIGTGDLDRLVIALSGAVAIWLGYRLFLGLSLAGKGTGKLDLPGGIAVLVSRAGPGVLLALLGAGLLAYGLHQDVRIETDAPPAVTASVEAVAALAPPHGSPGLSFDGVFEGRLSDATGTRPARTVLRRQVDRVTGVYSDGVGHGDISGIVEEDTLLFVWQSDGSRGRGRMQASPGGVEFSGTWGHGDASVGAGTWTGARRGR
jgi:hypothetical protein